MTDCEACGGPGRTQSAMPVLVAEDDAVYRCLLQNLLRRASFEVITVPNGIEALSRAESLNAPRLLILDWVMPGLDGPEVCRRLRSANRAQPYQYILLLTSKDAKADTVTGLEAGADDYLTKPFDSQELLARLRAGTRILELQDRLIATQKQLEYIATHDFLTDLWNRFAWKKLLAAEFERASRNASGIAVLMIDLDHFKKVNDSYGHSAGDEVLHRVGECLHSLIRAYDHAGRYGGEEFIVVAPHHSANDVHEYAERIRSGIARCAVSSGEAEISVTVSIGCVFTDKLTNLCPEKMVQLADHALYDAKKQGRNCVCLDDLSGPAQLIPKLSAKPAAVPGLS